MVARGSTLLGALVLTVGVVSSGAAAAQSPRTAPGAPAPADGRVDHALGRLRADATGSVRVHRDRGGRVTFVRSRTGRAMLPAPRTDAGHPRRAAAAQLARYGAAFGIDGRRSRAVVTQAVPSATGGSVVRARQYVDGLPVVGGDVVMSLDRHQGVVAVTSATTPATAVPSPRVTSARAAAVARGITARDRHVPAASLRVTARGEQLYDPALAHVADPLGARPVWSFVVTSRGGLRENVLVGAVRGEVALHYDDSPDLNRVICDNHEARVLKSTAQVPLCTSPVRVEGGLGSSVADVNAAYANLGATAATYASVAGIDLTQLIGHGPALTRQLEATVRWCFTDASCPFDNAFWDGRQMVFGAGYAAADDVVGHELTHGYVQHTANLFTFHQSGAINESLADTIGEIVDHRDNPTEDNSAWTVGEDLPGLSGTGLRSMKDPTRSEEESQPDRMRSPLYGTGDFQEDSGDVHQNNGVGNKAAYLISQGGTFNGVTVTGIDAGDPMLTKTALLYLETIPLLTSGAQYADLARELTVECDQLAQAGTQGFTPADCDSVRGAIAATQMTLPPLDAAAAAPQVAATCPTGAQELIRLDDEAVQQFDFALGALWQRTPANGTPQWASSGSGSLFAWDPDPSAYGDPASSSATSAGFVVPATPTYLHFHHAYVLDYDGPNYFDGGTVLVQTRNADGSWSTVDGLPWDNGPSRAIQATTPFVGYGGDSRGYETSRVELSSLAGRTARVVLQIAGDSSFSYVGWWVDDLREYTCTGGASPGTPRGLTGRVAATAGGGSIAWRAPAYAGTGVTHYRVTRSDGRAAVTLPTTARSFALTGISALHATTVRVFARNAAGQASAGPTVTFHPTISQLATPAGRVQKGRAFTVSVLVHQLGTPLPVGGIGVTLQRRAAGTHTWRTVSTTRTYTTGIRRWAVQQQVATYYRVLAHAGGTSFGSVSPVHEVLMR